MKLTTILNLFGLSTFKENKELSKNVGELTCKLSDSELRYKELFDWDLFKPEVLFQDYLKSIGEKRMTNSNFRNYYSKYHRSQYQAFRMRKLANHPDLLTVFLNEFSSFNYQETADYMKSVGWYWNDNKETPTVEDLKDCVITLVPLDDFDSTKNTIQSGGFSVSLYYKEGLPYCKISFNRSEVNG